MSVLPLRRVLCLLTLSACVETTIAATLPAETSLHLAPDSRSPVLATLPAGSSVSALSRGALAEAGVSALPRGWIALQHGGPFQGYVMSSVIGSDSGIPRGSAIHSEPRTDSQVIIEVTDNDRVEVIERGEDWSKVAFSTELIVFLPTVQSSRAPAETAAPQVGANTARPAPVDLGAAETASTNNSVASSSPRPQPVPAAAVQEQPPAPQPVLTNAPPREFQGYLMRTRRILGRGPRLDYQLLDERNRRIALLDLSGLALTAPLDAFEGKLVSVYGPGLRQEDIKDLIIRVETLRLIR